MNFRPLSGDPASPSQVLRAVLWLIVACYVVFVGWKLAGGYAAAGRGDAPLYTDYTPTYGASMLLRAVPAEYLYLQSAMSEAGREAARAKYGDITPEQAAGVGFSPFMYPPTFILLIAPLAYLPYLLSWFVWLAATSVPFLATMRRILPASLAWPFALAAPPIFYNLIYGQTGFLTAGLIGLGLTQLERKPVLAGVLIGLASVKPHFGLLIPIALIAGRHARVFFSATLTVLAVITASLFAFGNEPWLAFIGTSKFHLEGFDHGAYNLEVMTSMLSTARLAGASMNVAWLVQFAMMLLMAGTVAWAWSRRQGLTAPLRFAILCLASLVAAPSVYLYDLVLIVPAAAWIWKDITERGGHIGERILICACLGALILVRSIAEWTGVQTGQLFVMTLLALALWRLARSRQDSSPSLLGSALSQSASDAIGQRSGHS